MRITNAYLFKHDTSSNSEVGETYLEFIPQKFKTEPFCENSLAAESRQLFLPKNSIMDVLHGCKYTTAIREPENKHFETPQKNISF